MIKSSSSPCVVYKAQCLDIRLKLKHRLCAFSAVGLAFGSRADGMQVINDSPIHHTK